MTRSATERSCTVGDGAVGSSTVPVTIKLGTGGDSVVARFRAQAGAKGNFRFRRRVVERVSNVENVTWFSVTLRAIQREGHGGRDVCRVSPEAE